MLARRGAAVCILALFASCLVAWNAFAFEEADARLIVGSYALLGLAALMAAGATVNRYGSSRGRSDAEPPPATVDDLVGMLGATLKLASPVPTGQPEPIRIIDLFDELAERDNNPRLNLRPPPASTRTLAYRPALAQALEILVENGLSAGSRVSLSCDHGTSALVVYVDDDGPGIPRSERRRVFDWRFYLSTPPSGHKGYRAELVIARQILRVNGGDLSVGASPLGGARFTARMSLLGEHESESELAAAS